MVKKSTTLADAAATVAPIEMKKKRLILTLFASLFISALYAQENYNLHFRKIGVEDGLSEATVYCILQDSKGFMWFGTKDGLNRYDGADFRLFRKEGLDDGSPGNNFIHSMVEGPGGVLYVGTDAGLWAMDMAEESFRRIDAPTDGGEKVTSAVNTLNIDRDGNLWIGTMSQGVFVYDPSTGRLRSLEIEKYSLGSNATWSIITDRSGTTWVGTRLGLLRHDPETDRLEAVESIFSEQSSSRNEILCMLDDDRGNLWLGTWDDGIRLFDKQTGKYTSFYGLGNDSHYITHVRTIFRYTDDSLLVGSDDGLYLLDVATKELRRLDAPELEHSLSDQSIYSIAKDREGGVWIGTYFGGVNYLNVLRLNVETWFPYAEHGQLSGKAVSQFLEDARGNIWIATEDGGLNYFDTKTKEFSQPVETSYHNLHALMMDGDNLWIGTFSRGIDVYNTRSRSITNHRFDMRDENTIDDDCVFSIYKTSGGDIYVGTAMGLNRFDRSTGRFVRIPRARAFIYDMQEDGRGNLWIASYGKGVMRLDMDRNRWVHYDEVSAPDDPIVGSKLVDIHIDSRKRVIFSSEGRGIFIYDYKSDSFKNISEADGLPNDTVYGVLDDAQGNLWLSCNKGIVCFDTSEPRAYKLYDRGDGLQSNQFNYKSSFRASDGKFYFGGINGFSCFYPHDLSKNTNGVVPSVEISRIGLLGDAAPDTEREIQRKLNRGERIRLPYRRSSLAISYASLSYVSGTKNQYAYMLEGADQGWNHAGNNMSVTYVNLSPGKYLFRVKASNNDGLWSETGDAAEIEILPPLWMSTPALVIYVILALALVWLAVSRYLRANARQHRRQLETFKSEQEALAFKSKIDFFTTIAHEIRTPLSLIAAPLEEVISSGEGSVDTHRNLHLIEKNCDRLTVLIDQLLDFRKMESTRYVVNPETIDLTALLGELHERFLKTARAGNIDLRLDMPAAGAVNVRTDYDALTKITGNLLTNALKFTGDTIVLSLTLNPDGSYTIACEDNGRGIADSHKGLVLEPFYQVHRDDRKQGSGIGLSLVKHLAEVLRGTIEIKDSPQGGALIAFTFSDLPDERPLEHALPPADEDEDDDPDETKEGKSAVLVVDDNADLVRFIRNCLLHDYSVDTAAGAAEALEVLKSKNIDLVISDIMMPDMDGFSFTKMLRADLNYSHIPVIQLSARTGNDAKVEGLLSGADVFLEKPFSTSHLKAQIASLLENRKTLLEAFNRSPLASYSSLVTNKSDEMFLEKLNGEIEKHISDEDFTVESLTDVLGISRSGLQRKLKGISGVTPGTYLRGYRLRRACSLLLETDMRINEVAFYVGFTSASYFTKAFYKSYNMSPKEFVNQMTKADDSRRTAKNDVSEND
jgi:ligand-binding sensor domain-containing protein/signal transduction histidine kinase/DNA-binding response OmpR family regulator